MSNIKDYSSPIIITGGAGFIGSNLVKSLNDKGIFDIYIVDDLNSHFKKSYLEKLIYIKYFDKKDFRKLLQNKQLPKAESIIHLGACSDTTEYNMQYLLDNNVAYSKDIFKYCLDSGIKFIYASSAAVYGDGVNGYNENVTKLWPLNPYAKSKYLFDEWVIKKSHKPSTCVGLRFFNVYGPNEFHKGKMASMVFQAFNQVNDNGAIRLFKSYNKKYADGAQQRDFIYVCDVVDVIEFFLKQKNSTGIFNVGSGKARSFNDLAKALFKSMQKDENIQYIAMPKSLIAKYQYFTQADLDHLRSAGYKGSFTTIEEGIRKYVQEYLQKTP